jgi:hypothetical protein
MLSGYRNISAWILKLVPCLVLGAHITGCSGGGSNGLNSENPIPVITSLNPNSTTAGGPAFPGTKFVYSDDGHIVDPATGLPAGQFQASGLMVPDSTLNLAFFLGQTSATGGYKELHHRIFRLDALHTARFRHNFQRYR